VELAKIPAKLAGKSVISSGEKILALFLDDCIGNSNPKIIPQSDPLDELSSPTNILL
jgi:hypothetical protein